MASLQGNLEKLLRNRWAIIAAIVLAVAVVLIGYNFASWLFLQRIGRNLDEELGRRLQAVAEMTARVAETDLFNTKLSAEITEVDRLLLRGTLEELRQENQLQAIFLLNRQLEIILASPAHFEPGETISYLLEDSLQIKSALQGRPTASSMHVIEGRRFKSGYAPLRNAAERVIGVVVVEGSANFFSLISFFQRGLIIGGVASVALILLFTAFVLWAVTLFVRLQESVQRNERLAAMGQMAATVAHEVRNPMGIIKSTAEVLRKKFAKTDKDAELFDFIPQEVDRLNRLVTDFLAFARNRELPLELADFIRTVQRAVQDVQSEFDGSGTTITFSSAFPSLTIAHNADGIRQVILNLLHNAIEALGGRGSVSVAIRPGPKWGRKAVEVQVSDDGPGFQRDPDAIFEPFYTTKTSGSGLGLAVSKQIIEKHEGRIEAISPETGGTIIRFFIPAR